MRTQCRFCARNVEEDSNRPTPCDFTLPRIRALPKTDFPAIVVQKNLLKKVSFCIIFDLICPYLCLPPPTFPIPSSYLPPPSHNNPYTFPYLICLPPSTFHYTSPTKVSAKLKVEETMLSELSFK